MQFNEMGLDPRILKGIQEMGFEQPSPIQEQFIPLFLKKPTDIVGLAQTGTGKTAAFGLPMLQKIDPKIKVPQALILSPTRELCVQIAREITEYAKFLPEIIITPIYGGADIGAQITALRKGVHIVVGTPGRMHDMIRKNKIDLTQVSIMVLDEADEMLNMGFQEDVDAILEQTPKTKNTLLFSATMPAEVAAIAKNYMTNPVEIAVGKKRLWGRKCGTYLPHGPCQRPLFCPQTGNGFRSRSLWDRFLPYPDRNQRGRIAAHPGWI